MNPVPMSGYPDLRSRDSAGRTVQTPALDTDFVDALLAALTEMAVRSPRRQADLAVALRRAGIEGDAAMLVGALAQLEEDGCIEHLVPLTDGGLLVSVTAHGIERLSQTARRHVLDISGK